MISGIVFVKTLIETRTGLLYMVGKIFMYGIRFNIEYNNLGHKNMKIFEYLLGDNNTSTCITNQEVPVLSPTIANFIGQLSCILTNNLI